MHVFDQCKERFERIMGRDLPHVEAAKKKNQAMDLVFQKGGIEKAKDLARHHGDLALRSLDVLPECEEKESLQLMVEYVLERIS